eukprot:3629578-Pleurochrysis_carterae.AAC.1
MVRELDRVEREQREKDRAELASLRAQVAALAASHDRPSPAVHPQSRAPDDARASPINRTMNWTTLSIVLNVTALFAAITIGTMQLRDNGAPPLIPIKLCVLLCALLP